MPYPDSTKTEAKYVTNLAPHEATEDKFRATYIGILVQWFPASIGLMLDYQMSEDGERREYIVVRPDPNTNQRNAVLILKLEPPVNWNEVGKQEVAGQLQRMVQDKLEATQFDTVFGLGAIGLHWMACKMTKTGGPVPEVVVDWQDDVTSDESYDVFRDQVAKQVCEIA
jgi:hypothetical protein